MSKIVSPIITSALGSIVSSIIGVAGLIRTFVTFDSVSNTQINILNPIAVDALEDYEIELQYASYTTGAFPSLIGNSGTTASIQFLGDLLRVRPYNVTFTDPLPRGDGILHTIRITYDQNLQELSLFVDGVFRETIATTRRTFIYNVIGSVVGTNYFDGVIANIKVTNITTPSKSVSYNIDSTTEGGQLTYVNFVADDYETFTFDDATSTWIGNDIIPDGGFDDPASWVTGVGWTITGGQGVADGTGNFAALDTVANYSIFGSLYEVKFEIVSFVGTANNAINAQLIGATFSYGINNGGVGVKTYIDNSTRPDPHRFFVGSTGNAGTIDNLSITRLIQVAP